jgi:ABC-type nickel/cobalt efflux system permease component RcnA
MECRHADDPEKPETLPEKGSVRWKEILSLGISGGMVPCPSALAILLVAVALQKIFLGLLMIIAFSLGLASVLVTVGLVLVWTRSLLKPPGKEKRWISWLPVASSLVIMLIGIIMFGRIFLHGGLGF